MATGFEAQVEQAVQTLFGSGYTKPAIAGCLRQLGLPHAWSKQELRVLVDQALKGVHPHHSLGLDKLVACLDELQESGKQHAFLFSMPLEHRAARLAQLRDPSYVRERLRNGGPEDGGTSNRFIWDAESPTLAEVRYDREDGVPRLVLKWVETRVWQQKVGIQQNPANGQMFVVYQQREERSANFFRIDLRQGDSELLLQKLRANAGIPLEKELETYRGLVAHVLGFDPCVPVTLEPVVRAFFTGGTTDVKRWKVERPGGTVQGNHPPNPGLVAQLASGAFVGIELEYDRLRWGAQAGTVRVRLNAKTDQLEVTSPCSRARHHSILAEVREHTRSPAGILDSDLRAVADRDERLRPVMEKLDLHVSRLGEQTIDDRKLVTEEWVLRDEARRAIEALQRHNAERFRVAYYVNDPVTNDRVTDADGRSEYGARDEIPPTVESERNGVKVEIPTAANVWVSVSLDPCGPRPQWVLSLHGILTSGRWQKELTEHLNAAGFSYHPLDYGYFDLVRFLLAGARRKQVDRFCDAYTEFTRRHGVEKPSIIAHSFGTYIVALAIEKYGLEFDRIIVCGSIVRPEFPWARLLDERRVGRVLNDFALDDRWVKLVAWWVKDAGPSGARGFTATHARFYERGHRYWRHSDYFRARHYEKSWIPFLQGAKPLELEEGTPSPRNWRISVTGTIVTLLAAGACALYLFSRR